MKAQEAMQRELDDAAVAAAAADAGRELQDAYCVRRRVGNKTKRYVLEQEAENDAMAEALMLAAGDQQRARGQLWMGHDMTKACPDGSMVGTVNFFNIDNIAYGKGSMEEVVQEGQRVRAWVQAVVDHRSDDINVSGRVEKAFKDVYGRNDV